jgi:carboxylesterase type B
MRSLLSLVLLAATKSVLSSPLETRSTSIVDVGNAKYQGTLNSTTDVTNFLGIRYAAAPTGKLRFSAPTVPPSLTGVQDATSLPFQCHQALGGAAASSPWRPKTGPRNLQARELTESEDCLFLRYVVRSRVLSA